MKPFCRGFTLVELLVVIAIVGILAGLVLPCLSKARSKARMIEEMSSSRQLSFATHLYSDDHNGGVFPGYAADNSAVDDWGQRLSFPENARYPWRIVPYLSGSMALLYSGENRARFNRLKSSSRTDYVYGISVFPSLGINSYFMGGNETEFPAAAANAAFGARTVLTRLDDARHPARLIQFASARSAVGGVGAQGYYQITPPYLKKRVWTAVHAPDAAPSEWGFVAPRFNGRAVALFLDGHAEQLGWPQLNDMRHWCDRADRPDWTLSPGDSP